MELLEAAGAVGVTVAGMAGKVPHARVRAGRLLLARKGRTPLRRRQLLWL